MVRVSTTSTVDQVIYPRPVGVNDRDLDTESMRTAEASYSWGRQRDRCVRYVSAAFQLLGLAFDPVSDGMAADNPSIHDRRTQSHPARRLVPKGSVMPTRLRVEPHISVSLS